MSLNYAAFLDEPGNFVAPDSIVERHGAGLGLGGLKAGLYAPEGPVEGVLIFHHGGGASRAGYGGLADGVRRAAPVAVLVPDLRGHGDSAGRRGFAETPEAVWADIDTAIAWARDAWPDAAIFVGGHSSGGGLTINWAARRPAGSTAIDGLVLLAPMLSGARSDFATARSWVFLAYLFSGRRLMTRTAAVRFSYPPGMAADRGLVSAYSPGMAMAVTPRGAGALLARITAPMLLLAAMKDELFPPAAIRAVVGPTAVQTVDGGHLSCLLPAVDPIATFLRARLARRRR